MNFLSLLDNASERNGSLLCVGLDIDLAKIAQEHSSVTDALLRLAFAPLPHLKCLGMPVRSNS